MTMISDANVHSTGTAGKSFESQESVLGTGQYERAWAIVPNRGQCGLETSHTPLYHFAGCVCFLIP